MSVCLSACLSGLGLTAQLDALQDSAKGEQARHWEEVKKHKQAEAQLLEEADKLSQVLYSQTHLQSYMKRYFYPLWRAGATREDPSAALQRERAGRQRGRPAGRGGRSHADGRHTQERAGEEVGRPTLPYPTL